ncbi:oxygen-independent coproporphyrinogen III oxidase [Meiothermus taiwanensis WR-220]|uniref:Heme chaperone HemW n=2 Tax=Meiothermus taiwanensis TaxID=172827 RepID=A0A399E0Y3_9DEIN|nr:oxygen-independent coproporphyrinogen III oxidase [Meiothermus taiwanensis WR-220]KIQ53885.1 radical SAM protein [Meiothermus taiwanensis]KZK15184.1 coproporphyrinogen III oxidase [Meiothermus taiwanensis]RIH77378.1 Oxygen-independent coproporphyrinogen-III oxidase-like protein [Meiothermus taiwanensis]
MGGPALQHLYLHVPFCPTICPYCDFHVVRRYGDVVEAYLKRLAQEARGLFEQHPGPLTTLYLGGGTPSFLRSHELEALFRALPWNIEAAEVTLEANPGTLNPERLGLLRELGVNRISLGVQSFQDSVLKTLGRAHGRTGALRAVEMSLEAGFHTSIDLILGLPGQDVEADLAQATALGVEHVSAYTLQVEPGTPFALRGLAPDPDSEAQALALAQEVLGTAGLARYEVSNFARPGRESQHNLAYWRNAFWGGLGPGATGQLAGLEPHIFAVRYTNPPLPRWLQGEEPLLEQVGSLEHLKESLMLGLRLAQGVDLELLEQRSGLEVWPALEPAVRQLSSQGLLVVQQKRIRASDLNTLHPIILQLWDGLERQNPAPLEPRRLPGY